MTSVAALLKNLESEQQDAERLVMRAQQALDVAIRQALLARGKVEGVKAAQRVACGDQ